MSVEHWWNDTDREKLKYSEKNLSHYYFECHTDWPRIEIRPQ
jgi:hypothetical protein